MNFGTTSRTHAANLTGCAAGNQIPGIGASFNWCINNMGTVVNPGQNDSLSFPHVWVTDANYERQGPIAWVKCGNQWWARGGSGIVVGVMERRSVSTVGMDLSF